MVLDMTKDLIKTPSHYGEFVIQPVVFIMSNNFSFWRGNVIKYACRAGSKVYDGQTEVESEITDLKKAMRYCEMRINQLEGRGITNG
jgi:hypothetical protein